MKSEAKRSDRQDLKKQKQKILLFQQTRVVTGVNDDTMARQQVALPAIHYSHGTHCAMFVHTRARACAVARLKTVGPPKVKQIKYLKHNFFFVRLCFKPTATNEIKDSHSDVSRSSPNGVNFLFILFYRSLLHIYLFFQTKKKM